MSKSAIERDKLKFFHAPPQINEPKVVNVHVMKSEMTEAPPFFKPIDDQTQFFAQSTQTDLYFPDNHQPRESYPYSKQMKTIPSKESQQCPRFMEICKQQKQTMDKNCANAEKFTKVSEWGDWLMRENQMEATQLLRLEFIGKMLSGRGTMHENDSEETLIKSIRLMGQQQRENMKRIE